MSRHSEFLGDANDPSDSTAKIERRLGGLLTNAVPGRDVDLLLRVVAAPVPQATAAWREWRENHTIAGALPRQWRLLGAVGRKLLASEIDPEDRSALAAVKRRIWRDNQLRIRRHATILKSLHEAGIPTMVLKGGSRIASEDGAIETRFVRDIDLLFPSDRLIEALELLIGMGLRSVSGRLPGMVKSQAFARLQPPGQRALDYLEIDVHSVPLRLGQRADNERELWLRSVPATLGDVPVQIPSPADRFVQAIAHGLIADADAPVDWMLDALAALRDPAFCPQVVVKEIEMRRLGVPVAIGALILQRELGAAVPPAIIDACSRDVSRLVYRLEMKGLLKLSRQRSLMDRLVAEYSERKRVAGSDPVRRSWNTSWLFTPSLRAPTADWTHFHRGAARMTLPPSAIANSGRLRVWLSCPDASLGNRSFDLVLDGIWIGRVRLRLTSMLRIVPHRSWIAEIAYRLPSHQAHSGSGQLEIIALDDRKMPTATDLPGFRTASDLPATG